MTNDSDLFEGSSFPPLLTHKHYDASSVFTPENLLREARRQKGLAFGQVPSICVLDPDGDLVDYLHAQVVLVATRPGRAITQPLTHSCMRTSNMA